MQLHVKENPRVRRHEKVCSLHLIGPVAHPALQQATIMQCWKNKKKDSKANSLPCWVLPIRFHFCRQRQNIRNNAYLPLFCIHKAYLVCIQCPLSSHPKKKQLAWRLMWSVLASFHLVSYIPRGFNKDLTM